MSGTTITSRPFTLENAFGDKWRHCGLGWSQSLAERLLAFPSLNKVHEISESAGEGQSFIDRTLDTLNIRVDATPADLDRVPRTGPLIIVANHPFGGIDGLALASLVQRARPDVKVLANYLLSVVPALRESMIFVDPFNRRDSRRRNVASLRQATQWLQQSHGALIVFPAGEVSHATIRRPRIVDPAWSPSVAKLAKRSGAAVLPVFVEGRNSWRFQIAGMIHPRLRTLLLPREFLRKAGSTLRMRIGSPVTPQRLSTFKSDQEAIDYLRFRTHVLDEQVSPSGNSNGSKCASAADHEPIAPAQSSAQIACEIDALPRDRFLVESGEWQVCYARYQEIPTAMKQIGRLREIAFRAVGEGTGRALDLDQFDEHYIQLILWNRRIREIIGGYRLGPTDELLPKFGAAGLYTSTLFHYRPSLLPRINPALELGRSFVRTDFQRGHAPLMMLWKGISRYVTLNPRYRMLFGPVSISNEYRSMSRQLLIQFLKANGFVSALSRLIKPRHPLRLRTLPHGDDRLITTAAKSLDDVDELISDIETDRKSLPILLRQYLKLNGRLLGFNVDPAFGDVLDGLMLIDLTTVDRRILQHYMGAAQSTEYLRYHNALSLIPACC